MEQIVNILKETRDIERAKEILESNGYTVKKINESWPPILNSLARNQKEVVRGALKRLGIDIENTPFEEIVLSGARDPRIKDPKAMLIFPISKGVFHYGGDIGVWLNGEFIINPEIGSDYKSFQRMSWKAIMEVTDDPIMIKFDEDISAMMKDKQNARKESQQGMVKRYSKKEIDKMSYRDRRKFGRLDKSGYEVNPNKFKDMLAAMKIKDGAQILEDAKKVYVTLAQNLSAENMEGSGRGTFESYQYLIREIPEQFRELSKALNEYNKYKENPDERDHDGYWMKWLENDVKNAIKEMRELVKKAQKYM